VIRAGGEGGYLPAMEAILSMHANGEGVAVDYLQAGVGMQAAVTLDQANGESNREPMKSRNRMFCNTSENA